MTAGPGGAWEAVQDSLDEILEPRWLLDAVEAWLDEGESGCLLITAPPGYGKTEAMKLVRDGSHWTFAHFASRLHDRKSTEIAVIASLFNARVNEVARASGQVLPGYSASSVVVNQNIGNNYGEVSGVFVELHSPKDSRAVFRDLVTIPLTLLGELQPGQNIRILIDGLDEIDLPHGEVAQLLGQLTTIPAVQIVVTSKPLAHIVGLHIPNTTVLDMTSTPYVEQHVRDVRRFLTRPLAYLRNESLIESSEVEAFLSKVGGNFAYAKAVIRSARTPVELLATVQELPAEMADYYAKQISECIIELSVRNQNLASLASQVLALLSIASRPLKPEVIRDLTRSDASEVRSVILEIDPFLTRSQTGIALHHQSFALAIRSFDGIDRAHVPLNLPDGARVMAARVSEIVATEEEVSSWTDEYLAEYGIQHLLEGKRSAGGALAEMVDQFIRRAYKPSSLGLLTYGDFLARTSDENDAERYIRQVYSGLEVNPTETAGAILALWCDRRGDQLINRGIASSALFPAAVLAKGIHLHGLSSALAVRVADTGSSDLQQLVTYTLFSRWAAGDRSDVQEILESLAAHMPLHRPRRAIARARFLMATSILLYTHRVDDADLIAWGDRLWLELFVERFRLATILKFTPLKKLIVRVSAGTVAGQVSRYALWSTSDIPLSGAVPNQAVLRQAAQLIKPASVLAAHAEHVFTLLDGTLPERTLGAILLAAHVIRQPDEASINIARLAFEQGDYSRKTWVLQAFAAIFEVPSRVDELVRELTDDYVTGVAVPVDEVVADPLSAWLLPIALRTRTGPSTDGSERWYSRTPPREPQRLSAALGIAGVYSPLRAMRHLQELLGVVETELIVDALASIYVRHPQAVEQFLKQEQLGVRAQEVAAASSVARITVLTTSLGLFNNCLGQIVLYPTMRTELVETFFSLASTEEKLSSLIARYSLVVVNALEKHEYSLANWAR